MGILSGIGKVVKPFVNFPRWMGAERLKEDGVMVTEMAKDLMQGRREKQKRIETFEQAVARLGLSERDIVSRRQGFLRMSIIYAVFAVAILGYTLYLLHVGDFKSAILGVVLTAMVSVLSFKQHFWYFQMKQRRLGCSVKEWFRATFGFTKKGRQ